MLLYDSGAPYPTWWPWFAVPMLQYLNAKNGRKLAILGLISLLSPLASGNLAGAALPHFGRDGKGGDTCFFCPFDKFFGHFFLFFAPMSPDFAHCVTCFWNIQNPRYGNCHTCHTGVAAPVLVSSSNSWLLHQQRWGENWGKLQIGVNSPQWIENPINHPHIDIFHILHFCKSHIIWNPSR